MHKSKRFCMQRLTRTELEAIADKLAVLAKIGTFQYLITAIDIVIEKDMTDMFHVHPYLMGTSCLKIAFNQRNITKPFEHLIMGYGMLAYSIIR